jgi:hypothetical protein
MKWWSALIILAHSWYPHDCCGEGDCRPVPCSGFSEELKLSGHGELFSIITYTDSGKKFFMLRKHLRVSPDALCHACFQPGTFNMRCVFWPQKIS